MRARTQSELGASNDLVNMNPLKTTLLQLNYPYLSFMILGPSERLFTKFHPPLLFFIAISDQLNQPVFTNQSDRVRWR